MTSHAAVNVSSAEEGWRRVHAVERGIVSAVVAGVIRSALTQPGRVKRDLLKNFWVGLMRFGAAGVRNVELSRIRGIAGIRVEGPVARQAPLIVSALSQLLECERIFEFGTYVGETTRLLAHNLPSARIYSLDTAWPEAPARTGRTNESERSPTWERSTSFSGTPEAASITRLYGNSATFDFSPYRGSIDLVYVDASHGASCVRCDTEAALRMLSELGTIVWHDYTHTRLYAYLNELAPSLDRPIFHILDTSLALYSRWQVVLPDD